MSTRYAALRVPAFRDYLFGSVVVQVGTAAQSVAVGWEVYTRTGSAWSLAWVALAQALPMLLLTLPAGVMADRYDRRTLLVIGLIGSTLASVGLAWVVWRQHAVGWVYGLLLLDATFLRAAWPARTALLPNLVPRDVFEDAVKWRTSLGQISGLFGPAIGGFLLTWSTPGVFLFSAVSTSAFIGLLLRTRVPSNAVDVDPSGRAFGRIVPDLVEGLKFVWTRKILLAAISLDLFAVLLGGAVYLLPVFAGDILGVGETGLGWLRAAPAAGAMVTALVLAHLPPLRRAGPAMLWGVAGFGVATIVFGVSTSFWLSLAMLFLTGVFDNVSVVVRHTLVQLATPDTMRGRVSAVNAVFIGSSNEVGGFESAAVAAVFGPRASVVIGGAGTLAIVGLWAFIFPSLRRLGRLDTDSATDIPDATPPGTVPPVTAPPVPHVAHPTPAPRLLPPRGVPARSCGGVLRRGPSA